MPGFLLVIILMLTIFSIAGIISGVFDRNPNNIQNNSIVTAIDRVRSTTAVSRLVVYNEAIQAIIKSPFVGVGFDQIATSGVLEKQREISGTVHNSLIQIFYVGGIIAFLGLIFIYADLTINSLKGIFYKGVFSLSFLIICLAAASLAIILMDQFQSSLYQREKWLIVGMYANFLWSEVPPWDKMRKKNENC